MVVCILTVTFTSFASPSLPSRRGASVLGLALPYALLEEVRGAFVVDLELPLLLSRVLGLASPCALLEEVRGAFVVDLELPSPLSRVSIFVDA